MAIARSLALFVLAALFEIGGAWLVWQGLREHRGWAWVGGGFIALGLYGLVATFQPSGDFGRILAAYGRDLRRRLAAVGLGRRRLPARLVRPRRRGHLPGRHGCDHLCPARSLTEDPLPAGATFPETPRRPGAAGTTDQCR